jgi:hypothetical protein
MSDFLGWGMVIGFVFLVGFCIIGFLAEMRAGSFREGFSCVFGFHKPDKFRSDEARKLGIVRCVKCGKGYFERW